MTLTNEDAQANMNEQSVEAQESFDLDVAIVGMAGRFPGARNVEALWQNLCDGKEAITFFTNEELLQKGYDAATLEQPNLVKAASVLEDIGMFDAAFFGYSPREAEQMDPQQRLFLECAWEALEDAGCNPETYKGLIGVYAGTGINTYLMHLLSGADEDQRKSFDGLYLTIGNDKDYLTTRLSYKLHLNGPSVCVQTACSTSLVAVHLACQSLRNYECDVALAGGVSVRAPQFLTYLYQEGGIHSPDGHCRTFDAQAQGTIFGNGLGTVVLKRLTEALADGDHIYAVIKGSAINNDGSAKVGFTAPSVDGQVSVIKQALAVANLSPQTIGLIEAHGTATPLGDAIEMTALKQVFGQHQEIGSCAIGSIKTNLGHLDTAAGIAGLIKAALSLKHKLLPPSLHFEKPNPELKLENSPFYVNTRLQHWNNNHDLPRRAGVSSFGIGGTNAHAVLEEAPQAQSSQTAKNWHVLTLSAHTSDALNQVRTRLLAHWQRHSEQSPADIAFTLQTGRKAFSHRQAIVAQTREEFLQQLASPQPESSFRGQVGEERPKLIFMFPGQGAQYPGMTSALYRAEPNFRSHLDRCFEILRPSLDIDLRQLIFESGKDAEQAAALLEQTQYTQPALFAIEYALARWWRTLGVMPQGMIGHSLGEYVAACLAGVMTLEDALRIVAARGQLMQAQPHGIMLAVGLDEASLRPLLPSDVSLAAVNADQLCVISGPPEAMESFRAALDELKISSRRLHTSHAYHSPMMEPALEPFRSLLQQIPLKPPQLPFISNVTGEWITDAEATSASYWANHLRVTVRFGAGLRLLCRESSPILLEVGPGRTLTKLARQLAGRSEVSIINALPAAEETGGDEMWLTRAIGQLWSAGIKIDWKAFYSHEKRLKVSLPTYPFETQSFWCGATEAVRQNGSSPRASEQRQPLQEWLYAPAWQQSVPARLLPQREMLDASRVFLIFSEANNFSADFAAHLRVQELPVVEVRPGESFRQLDDDTFEINALQPADYEKLFATLQAEDKHPSTIAHLWGVTTAEAALSSDVEMAIGNYNSLICLAQAVGTLRKEETVYLFVISNQLFSVKEGEKQHPAKALMLGPSQVIPQEYPNIECVTLDIEIPATAATRQSLLSSLQQELQGQSKDSVVAYRNSQRWVRTFSHFNVSEAQSKDVFGPRGVYLITGGLGGLALALARHLAETRQAKLALVNRHGLPPREEWQSWLGSHAENELTAQRIKKVLELEAMGSEVLVLAADVAEREQIALAVQTAVERFGRLDGVFHLAGVPGGGLIQMKDAQARQPVFTPKVQGTLALYEALRGMRPDFMLSFSSTVSLTGGLGQVDYCAACAFLNSVSTDLTTRAGFPVMTVAWDAWQQDTWQENLTGMMPELQQAFKEQRKKFGITLEEGLMILRQTIKAQLPLVIVSTQELLTTIERHKIHARALLRRALSSARPVQSTKTESEFIPPRTQTEEIVAGIWRETLGIERISVQDNFLSLGGHSLLAVQVMARLREELKTELPLRMIFDRPTVAAMAELIEAHQTQTHSEDEIAGLLAQIEQLSEEEARENLAALHGLHKVDGVNAGGS